MLSLCAGFGEYGMYGEAPISQGFGAGMAQRHDAARNFIMNGGRFARDEPVEKLAARTNYFRESYAYAEPLVDGIEEFHGLPCFVEGAREIFGRSIVVPQIVYANLLVPGQELAIHTDVPEFRGCNRTKDPEWLLVAMHHSGLFDHWRIPIATGVAWFNDCDGGEFAFYPEGRDAPAETVPARYNTAVIMDTDSWFHGVDRLKEYNGVIPDLMPGMKLNHVEGDNWVVTEKGEEISRYKWDQLRFSVSWKAYCFKDEDERRAWREHSDDIAQERAIEMLVADMGERKVFAERPSDDDLPLLMIDEYISFPASTKAAISGD